MKFTSHWIGLGLLASVTACAQDSTSIDAELRQVRAAATLASTPLSVDWTTDADWGTGYNGSVIVTNTGTATITDWRVLFDLPPGAALDYCQLDGAEYEACESLFQDVNGRIRITSAEGTEALQPGESLTFYLGGERDGNGEALTATRCAADGQTVDGSVGGNVGCDGSADLTEPPAPATVTVEDHSESTVSLSWDAVDEPDVIGYQVFNLFFARGGNIPVAQVTGTSATISGLRQPGTENNFYVVAVDGAGNLSTGNDNLVTVELDPQTLAFEFNQVSAWDSGFQGEILMTNLGVDPIVEWTFVFEQPGLTDSWGAKFNEAEEGVYHVWYPDEDPEIEPGETVAVGYTADSLDTPQTAVWRGSTCTLDGSPCVMQ